MNPKDDITSITLLDVDQTLIFEKDPAEGFNIRHINTHLLLQLLANGNRDVFLFTDMTFKQNGVLERAHLKQILENFGFNVHGVITSVDPFWHLPEAEVKSFYDKFGENKINLAREVNVDKLDAMLKDAAQYPHISALFLDQNISGQHRPGDPFSSVTEQGINETVYTRSQHCKALLEMMAFKENIASKGVLFEYFISHMPNVKQVYVADDRLKVIEVVQKIGRDKNINIKDIWVRDRSAQYDHLNQRNPLPQDRSAFESLQAIQHAQQSVLKQVEKVWEKEQKIRQFVDDPNYAKQRFRRLNKTKQNAQSDLKETLRRFRDTDFATPTTVSKISTDKLQGKINLLKEKQPSHAFDKTRTRFFGRKKPKPTKADELLGDLLLETMKLKAKQQHLNKISDAIFAPNPMIQHKEKIGPLPKQASPVMGVQQPIAQASSNAYTISYEQIVQNIQSLNESVESIKEIVQNKNRFEENKKLLASYNKSADSIAITKNTFGYDDQDARSQWGPNYQEKIAKLYQAQKEAGHFVQKNQVELELTVDLLVPEYQKNIHDMVALLKTNPLPEISTKVKELKTKTERLVTLLKRSVADLNFDPDFLPHSLKKFLPCDHPQEQAKTPKR